MSVAFYIVLDDDDPDFDPFVDGKALAHELERLDLLTARLGLRSTLDFLSQDFRDVDGPGGGSQWFAASDGLAWVAALRSHLRRHPEDVGDPSGVLRDLDAYAAVLERAAAAGLRWHLELDL